MKKLKRILSLVLTLALLCTSFVFAGTVNAATTSKREAGTEVNLQDNIQDGVILHAFCWGYSEIKKNLPAIAAAGYSAVQTSPVQQPKDMNSSTDIAGQWWKLYQPVSLSIADNSWLGTEDELKDLCQEAHKYGIKIICDIVSNHLGADSQLGVNKLAAEVQTYEPTIWNSNGLTSGNSYIHQKFTPASDSDIQSVVQGTVSACPDLNTGNSHVQSRVVSLLKECIDCGVDGFRFDAAKHIETPDDGSYASNYWTNVLSQATNHAKSTQNKDMYYYGEVLNTVGPNRNVSSYTSRMSITDNKTSNSVLNNVKNGNASSAASPSYQLSNNAAKTVLWAESHDTYEGTTDVTKDVSNENIVKAWAIVAARKDASALYFARPGSMSMGGCATDATYKSVAVAEVNKFHNNFVGQNEKLGASGNIAYVARGTSGIVLVNTKGTTASASVGSTGLADGSYTDMVTGNKFTVSGGTVSGTIGSTGVAVVTTGTTTPTVSADKESQTFEGESIAVKLTLNNAVSGTYQLENYAPQTFTGSPTIRIGSDYSYGETIKLTLTATDGTATTTTVYEYVKKQGSTSGVYAILPASVANSNGWTAPYYCYVYDEKTKSKAPTYKNAAWPGEEMKYDSTLDCYYVQVQNNSCFEQSESSGSQTLTPSTFNLAASSNTCVIVSDSSSQSGAGTSAGKQFPGSGNKNTCKLAGTSHEFTSFAFDCSGWVTTNKTPGQSSQVSVPATEVTKGNETVATNSTTSPATQATTAAPIPVGDFKYGDTNLDGTINISDVTAIQKHIADIQLLSGNSLKAADVDANGKVRINDATYVQKYIASMSNTANVGKEYSASTPVTQPVTLPPATEAPTDAPVVTTPIPSNTYTAYLKTQLTWMTDMGCSLFLYDNNSGISYLMAKDDSAYPNVYTATVPESCSSVTFYRALTEVNNPAQSTEAYNLMPATLSKTNNCYTLTDFPDGGTPTGSVGPYVAEAAPDFSLTRLYVDNSAANWQEIYLYGWGVFNQNTYPLEQISGTSIWYIDLPSPVLDGEKTFLLKNTPGKDSWDKKSNDITVTKPYNCYKLSSTSGADGTWTNYNG